MTDRIWHTILVLRLAAQLVFASKHMHNCLIIGSGRSGTSMVAGSLSGAGYFLGEHLHSPTSANPKGFFEDLEVNSLNEDMLALVLPRRPRRWPLRRLLADRPDFMQRWVAVLAPDAALPELPRALAHRRDRLVEHQPFLFKDPRFCYTLPYWRGALRDVRIVCVFREPGRTARSILRECESASYMHSLRFGGRVQALRVWTCMYRHVLRHARVGGDWLFVHYDQFLDGPGADALESFLDAPVDRSFAEHSLKRTVDDPEISDEARRIYKRLCTLASFEPTR